MAQLKKAMKRIKLDSPRFAEATRISEIMRKKSAAATTALGRVKRAVTVGDAAATLVISEEDENDAHRRVILHAEAIERETKKLKLAHAESLQNNDRIAPPRSVAIATFNISITAGQLSS
jgi:hypothetical protein